MPTISTVIESYKGEYSKLPFFAIAGPQLLLVVMIKRKVVLCVIAQDGVSKMAVFNIPAAVRLIRRHM